MVSYTFVFTGSNSRERIPVRTPRTDVTTKSGRPQSARSTDSRNERSAQKSPVSGRLVTSREKPTSARSTRSKTQSDYSTTFSSKSSLLDEF